MAEYRQYASRVEKWRSGSYPCLSVATKTSKRADVLICKEVPAKSQTWSPSLPPMPCSHAMPCARFWRRMRPIFLGLDAGWWRSAFTTFFSQTIICALCRPRDFVGEMLSNLRLPSALWQGGRSIPLFGPWRNQLQGHYNGDHGGREAQHGHEAFVVPNDRHDRQRHCPF